MNDDMNRAKMAMTVTTTLNWGKSRDTFNAEHTLMILRDSDKSAHVKGFADDAAVVQRGPDLYTLIERGQEAISRALEFGYENGLVRSRKD